MLKKIKKDWESKAMIYDFDNFNEKTRIIIVYVNFCQYTVGLIFVDLRDIEIH